MTKEEIRVVTLAKLCLKENMVLWDVGAGTGSVAIEAARLLSRGMVFAVEKDPQALELLQENAGRLEIQNLVPIFGEAPEILCKLPPPERVFVGGSGGKLEEILGVICERMSKEGVLVVNSVTLETVTQSLSFLEGMGFQVELLFLQVARGERVGDKHLLRAQNPVYLVQGRKGEIK